MKREFDLSSRREFIGQSAGIVAVLGTIAAQRAQAAGRNSGNPFAYDISRLQQTDPKLVTHAETARWKAPRSDTRRLAMAPDGRLGICAGNYLTLVDAAGEPGREFAFAEPTRCAVVDPEGRIYVGLRDHVEVLDASGARQASWESVGKKAWITSLAVTAGDVYAADAGNRMILRYDKSGKLVQRLGEKNPERNVPGFIIPSPFFDVEVPADGLLRVTNPGRHRVDLYTADGDYEGSWGTATMGIAGFCGCCNPINLALLPDGRYVTCEKGLPRVKIYTATGEFESVVAGVESFSENARACGPADCTRGGLDAVVDAQGRIYILDLVTATVQVMGKKA